MKKETDDYSAGEMRTLVTVQKPVYTDDGAGGKTIGSWVLVMKIYCYRQQKKSWEKYGDGSTGGRLITTDIWEFTTWYQSGVTTEHRLMIDGKQWNIRSVENLLDRNKYLRLTAEAGVEV